MLAEHHLTILFLLLVGLLGLPPWDWQYFNPAADMGSLFSWGRQMVPGHNVKTG